MTTTDTTASDALRDPRIEAWLDANHAQWDFDPDFDLGRIDRAKSAANQARLQPLDEDVVARYAADLDRGDTFPPIVVHQPTGRGNRKAVVIGGNHRVAATDMLRAANRDRPNTFPAYIVRAEPETVLRLTYEDNRHHGLPPSDDERIAQAIHLIDTGCTQEEAARIVGVTPNKVSRARAVIVADRRAQSLDVAGFTTLPKTARSRLASVRSDPVFAEASKLVVAAQLQTEDVYGLVTRINDAKSDKAALELIGSELEERRQDIQSKASKSRNAGRSARAKLNDALYQIIDADPRQVAAACANDDQRKAMLDRAKKAAKSLLAIGKALEG